MTVSSTDKSIRSTAQISIHGNEINILQHHSYKNVVPNPDASQFFISFINLIEQGGYRNEVAEKMKNRKIYENGFPIKFKHGDQVYSKFEEIPF